MKIVSMPNKKAYFEHLETVTRGAASKVQVSYKDFAALKLVKSEIEQGIYSKERYGIQLAKLESARSNSQAQRQQDIESDKRSLAVATHDGILAENAFISSKYEFDSEIGSAGKLYWV
jgi:hypothetical protein